MSFTAGPAYVTLRSSYISREVTGMTKALWVPEGVDISRSSPARIYGYMPGGGHVVDRAASAKFLADVQGGRYDI
jgi:hypothetical protein